MNVELMLAIATSGGVFLFLSGWFFARAAAGKTRAGHPEEMPSKPALERPAEAARQQEAIEGLQRELEIAREELRKKDQHIEELRTNTNRLGQRILEVESELHAKEEEMRELRAKNSPQELLESMDPFVEALQKESDQLREELETAYRLINRQELELSRLRSSSVDFQPDETAMREQMHRLEDQLHQLQKKCERYEAMMLKEGLPREMDITVSDDDGDPSLPHPTDSPTSAPQGPASTHTTQPY